MANGWTPERKAKHAEAIRRWKPWERSTGPKTPEGKEVSKMNGWKGGEREVLRQLRATLALHLEFAQNLEKS